MMVNSGGNLSETPLQKLLHQLSEAIYENMKDLTDLGADGEVFGEEAETLAAIAKVYKATEVWEI